MEGGRDSLEEEGEVPLIRLEDEDALSLSYYQAAKTIKFSKCDAIQAAQRSVSLCLCVKLLVRNSLITKTFFLND